MKNNPIQWCEIRVNGVLLKNGKIPNKELEEYLDLTYRSGGS